MKKYRRKDYTLKVAGDGETLQLSSPQEWLIWEQPLKPMMDDEANKIHLLFLLRSLPATGSDWDGNISRIAICLKERRWAAIPWESLAPAGALMVRSCPVRPRVAQIPLAFPLRILESGGTPIVEDALRAVFRDSDRSMAVMNGFAEEGAFAAYPENHHWPTVEILHLRGVEPGQVRCLQEFSERFQTRLIIIEADQAMLPEFRLDAQTLVERGGPAVWLADAGINTCLGWYAHIVHDRPLDWIMGQVQGGELFAGAGREELLRYSGVGEALSSAAIKTIAREMEANKIPDYSPPGPETQGKTMVEIVRETLDASARELRLQGDELNIQLEDPPRNLRLASAISTKLMSLGLVADGIDRALQGREWSSLKVGDFVKQVGRKTEAISGLSSQRSQKLVASRLKHLANAIPTLSVESHESEGMLPIAAKMAEVRSLLGAVRGQGAQSPRPPRHVNAAFFAETEEGGLAKLAQSRTRLAPGQLYHLGVQIGEKDQLTETLGPTALIEEVFRSTSGCWIEIGVTAIDFELIGDPVQRLWLPAEAGTDLASFALTPKPSTTLPGIARLRFSIFHENNLVQSFLMAAVLADAGGNGAAGLAYALNVDAAQIGRKRIGYLMRMEYSQVEAMSEANAVQPRALTLIANQSAGEKVVTLKGEELFSVMVDLNLPKKVQNARDALQGASLNEFGWYRFMFNQQDNAGNPDELCDVLWETARSGWGIFSMLVRGPEERRLLRERLEGGGGIHAAHVDASTVIPWSLLYDRPVYAWQSDPKTQEPVTRAVCRAKMPSADGVMPPGECGGPGCLLDPSENERRRSKGEPLVCEDTVICPRRFWGFSYPIEVPAQQVDGVAGLTPPPVKAAISAAAPLRFVAGFNPLLQFADKHRQSLSEAFGQQGVLITPTRSGRDAVRHTLAGDDADIVYLYCHALATVATAKRGEIGPVFDFGAAVDGNHPDILEAEDFEGDDWSHAPLVFMNGCGNIGFSPYAPSVFIKQFIQARKASAVVGTEVTVWEVLATEFAQLFFREFVNQHASAGEALLRARRALLAKNNPLGLIYTLYGNSQLIIRQGKG